MMKTSIYTRHRFHLDIIRRAVWMYFRFNLSFRDVEELMIERDIDVSYETVRRWVDKFSSQYAKRIKSRTKSTEVQICEERSKATFSPRSNLQSLQSSTPSHLQKHTSKVQATRSNRMEFREGIS